MTVPSRPVPGALLHVVGPLAEPVQGQQVKLAVDVGLARSLLVLGALFRLLARLFALPWRLYG